MTFFAVHYSYVDDSAALDELRPQHRAHLRALFDNGLLVASGPLDTEPSTALLLFRTESEAVVRDALNGDPFMRAGLVREHTVTPWRPVIGVFAQE